MASIFGTSLGLNILQIVQNELQSREILEGHIGYGTRLRNIDERLQNAEAIARNGRVWKAHHHLGDISSLQPQKNGKRQAWEVHSCFPRTVGEFKELENEPEKVRALLTYYNITVYVVDDQEDELSSGSTSSDSDSDSDSDSAYSSIARHNNKDSRAGRLRRVDLHRSDQLRDIRHNMDTCMEELAITWGLDWHRIGGGAKSSRATVLNEAQLGRKPQDFHSRANPPMASAQAGRPIYPSGSFNVMSAGQRPLSRPFDSYQGPFLRTPSQGFGP